jgi:hypothetical protein
MNTLLAGLLPALLDIAMLLVTALAGWLAARAARWLNLQNEEALRRPLLDLVDALAAGVRHRLPTATPSFAQKIVTDMADHIERSYPERLAKLAVDRTQIENMFRVRLGLTPEPRP